jgi:glycerol-3-phosphate dehydrogenase (NAD(P)+)
VPEATPSGFASPISGSAVDRVVVIGAGSWGTAVAMIASTNAPTTLWARRADLAAAIEAHHENAAYLPGVALPPQLRATDDLLSAVERADVVVMGVPSHGFRTVLAEARSAIAPHAALVSLSKGVEQGSLLRMSEVIADVVTGHDLARIGVLTGPNLAKEIAAGQPAASVIALPDPEVAARLQQIFLTPAFRVYTNPDVVGCEIAGALKNVIALGVGMAHGLGFGDNAKAALITRGLAELARLGVTLGGDPLTFAGLAGMGDLIATCSSPQSRNRSVGVALGEGRSLNDIVSEMNMVAEGVKSTAAVLELAARHGVDMPVAEFVGRVLYEGAKPAEHVGELMGRSAKAELHGMRDSRPPRTPR